MNNLAQRLIMFSLFAFFTWMAYLDGETVIVLICGLFAVGSLVAPIRGAGDGGYM